MGGLNLGSSRHIGTTTWVGGCTEYFSGVQASIDASTGTIKGLKKSFYLMHWINIWNYTNGNDYHLEIKIFCFIEQTITTSGTKLTHLIITHNKYYS